MEQTACPLSDGYPSDWLRGVLGVAALRIVADGPTYGYALAVRLADAGFGQIKGGTLYPLLGRFEEAGHVTTEWREGDGGPGRKFYAITPSGLAALAEQTERWLSFSHTVTALLTPTQTPTGADR